MDLGMEVKCNGIVHNIKPDVHFMVLQVTCWTE